MKAAMNRGRKSERHFCQLERKRLQSAATEDFLHWWNREEHFFQGFFSFGFTYNETKSHNDGALRLLDIWSVFVDWAGISHIFRRSTGTGCVCFQTSCTKATNQNRPTPKISHGVDCCSSNGTCICLLSQHYWAIKTNIDSECFSCDLETH